jgi:hypothetical protein
MFHGLLLVYLLMMQLIWLALLPMSTLLSGVTLIVLSSEPVPQGIPVAAVDGFGVV